MGFNTREIKVTKTHLALLERFNPEDAKRPYGSSDIWGDLVEVYAATEHPGSQVFKLDDGDYLIINNNVLIEHGQDLHLKLDQLHADMKRVAEIEADCGWVSEATYISRWDKLA